VLSSQVDITSPPPNRGSRAGVATLLLVGRRFGWARAALVGGGHCAGQPAAVLHVGEDSGHRADKQHFSAAHSSIGNCCTAFGGRVSRAYSDVGS
jgi:hypothetical protein